MSREVEMVPCCLSKMLVYVIPSMLTEPVLKRSFRFPHILYPALDAGDAVNDVLRLAVDRGVDVYCVIIGC